MRDEIHPNYGPVVFQDAGGFAFLTRSTITSGETTAWEDGNSQASGQQSGSSVRWSRRQNITREAAAAGCAAGRWRRRGPARKASARRGAHEQ